MKYIAVIPARGGSKRVSFKNVRNVEGRPLIVYSIEAAKESKYIEKIIVSTDNPSIQSIAEHNDVDVIVRPPQLSGDDVGLTPVIQHVLEIYDCENVVTLRPTSPIRINNIIDRAIEKFEEENADSLMTGFINKEHEWFTHPDMPSQKMEGWFQGDGCVEINKSSVIKQGKSYGEKCVRFEVPQIYNYEIDTPLDLEIVSFLIKYLMKDKGLVK